MDFRKVTSILSCSNLEEGFTNRILVVLMDLSKIDLFSHRFYLNLYMYEISTSTVLYTIACTPQKYGFTSVGGASLVSRVFLPSSLQSYNGIF